MEFWDESPVIDETFAAVVRAHLDATLPDELRERPFDPPFDWGFERGLRAWQDEHLAEATPGQRAAYRREVERVGLPVTSFTTSSLVARTVEAVGTDEQRATIVAALDAGTARCALGYTEPESGSDVAAARTRAVRDGDEWVISGQKMFTSYADSCTHVFLLTRTDPGLPKRAGLTMFLVPLDAPGVEVRRVDTLGYHPTCMTFYDGVRVPASAVVGEVDGGWAVMRVALDFEHGSGGRTTRRAPGEGGGERRRSAPRLGQPRREVGKLLDRTAHWAAERGPDGSRPIDDPVVRERLGRIAVEDEVGRLLARRNDPDGALPGVGNAAKLWWTELYVRASEACLDMVGPEALLPHDDADTVEEGWVEYAFRAAPVQTIAGGSSEVQRDVIAQRRLGLPRMRGRS